MAHLKTTRHNKPQQATPRFPLSLTGPLEGTNNKIKTLQKMAYDFQNKELLKLMTYSLLDP